MSSRLNIPTDRRAVLFGLGAAAATASFAPFVTASAASAAPVVGLPTLGAPVTALYWNLPYNDFTGLAAGLKASKRKAETVSKDLDPHAELLAG